jgi:hypothetical protein
MLKPHLPSRGGKCFFFHGTLVERGSNISAKDYNIILYGTVFKKCCHAYEAIWL